MNSTKMKKIAAIVLALMMIASVLTACGEKPVTVTVIDADTKTEVETETGKTVSDVLTDAKITLGDKDECEPKADEKITEDTKEITVKRYAKVTVVRDDQEIEVELVGGTVEDALKKANITLADNESLDTDPKAYLKDGLVITITKSLKVTVTVDGKTSDISTSAKTVQAVLDEQNITVSDDDVISEKLDAEVTEGMKIVIKRVTFENETKTETIDYETEEQYDSSLAQGSSKVTQDGVEGEKEVTYKVKYIDGVEASRDVVSEKVTKEPVKKIVTYGTYVEQQQPQQQQQQTQQQEPQQSGGKTVTSVVPVYDCDGSGHGYNEIHYSDGSVEYEEF